MLMRAKSSANELCVWRPPRAKLQMKRVSAMGGKQTSGQRRNFRHYPHEGCLDLST